MSSYSDEMASGAHGVTAPLGEPGRNWVSRGYGQLDALIKQHLDRSGDPRVRHWLLLQETPLYCLALTLAYLITVYTVPRIMQRRKPFELRHFMVVYNLALVALSVYMFVEIVLSSYDAGYGIICNAYNVRMNPTNPKELRIAAVLWVFFASKAVEFMDTILMVLRKKNDQVTFLHVYHHASMLNIWWWVMNFVPGGQSVFSSSINSLVHVFMYSYYGFSLFPSLRPYLWWKRYITQMQLLQFFVILLHTVYTHVGGCDFPGWAVVMLTGYMVSLIALFGNFYVRTYSKRRALTKHE